MKYISVNGERDITIEYNSDTLSCETGRENLHLDRKFKTFVTHTHTLSSSIFLCIMGDVDPSSPSVLLHWLPTSCTTWLEIKKTFTFKLPCVLPSSISCLPHSCLSQQHPPDIMWSIKLPWAIAGPALYSEQPGLVLHLQVTRSVTHVSFFGLPLGHRWRCTDSVGALCEECSPWCS